MLFYDSFSSIVQNTVEHSLQPPFSSKPFSKINYQSLQVSQINIVGIFLKWSLKLNILGL